MFYMISTVARLISILVQQTKKWVSFHSNGKYVFPERLYHVQRQCHPQSTAWRHSEHYWPCRHDFINTLHLWSNWPSVSVKVGSLLQRNSNGCNISLAIMSLQYFIGRACALSYYHAGNTLQLLFCKVTFLQATSHVHDPLQLPETG